LQRIVGRERNLLRRTDGSRHWPLVGFHLFDGVAPVRQYQFIQHELARIEFRVVTDAPLREDQERGLLEIATNALGREFKIALAQSRTRLPSGPGGKFEEFVCRL
jgi:phenylacetate-CoA ligase